MAYDVLEDLKALIKPHCKTLSRKNEVLPFEDINLIEFLSVKNDFLLFTLRIIPRNDLIILLLLDFMMDI